MDNNSISIWETGNEDFIIKLRLTLNKKWNFGFEIRNDSKAIQHFVLYCDNPKLKELQLEAVIVYCRAFNDGYEAANMNWGIN